MCGARSGLNVWVEIERKLPGRGPERLNEHEETGG